MKTKTMKTFQCFYWIGLCLLISASLQAQLGLDTLSIDSLNALGYDPLVRIYDIDGQEYSPFEMLVPNGNPSNPNPSPASGPHVTTCNAGMFELFFEDVHNNTGSGFDNLTPTTATTTFPTVTTLGEMRQQVLCRVYSDLSAFLGQAPGTSITPTVRIKIPASGDFDGNITGVASSYYVVPRGTSAAMLDGEVWKTINLGYDSWSTLPPNTLLSIYLTPTTPSGEYFHGYSQFFFNDNTTNLPLFHYDYTTPNTNTSLVDLYSLALHEAVHNLGFASLFDGNGLSRMRSTSFAPGCARCYTRYDGYLNSANAIPNNQILDDDNPLSPIMQIPTGQIIPSLATACSNPLLGPVLYNGLNHFNQEVFCPNPFITGSSLTHFSCDCPSSTGYSGAMLACNQMGTDQRFLNQAEVNVLCDLGYQRGNAWTINGTNIANYTSCSNTPCLAIGGNDYQDANGVQYTATIAQGAPVPLTISNILDNDGFPTGSTPSILNDNVQILSGGGTVTVNGTNITYSASTTFAGWAILAYVPTCAGSAINGNPTYIFIRVNPEPAPCNNFNCNLICSGNLEQGSIAFYRDAVSFFGANITTFYSMLGNGNVRGDFVPFLTTNFSLNANGTIPVGSNFGAGCFNIDIDGLAPNSIAPFSNNNVTFLRLSSSRLSLSPNRTGIQLDLVTDLDQTEPYTLTFWAIADPGCLVSPEVHIYGTNQGGCNGGIPLNNTLGGISTVGTCITQLIGRSTAIPTFPNNANNAQEWRQYMVTIDPVNMSNDYNRIYITLQDMANGTQASAYLDEFELYGDNTTAVSINSSTTNPNPCINSQGAIDAFTIDYEVCLDDPLLTSNPSDISLQVDLNGFDVLGGDFDASGALTIPTGSQSTTCATYSIILTAPSPNTIQPGLAINIPISLTSIGASCITNTASILDVGITPIQNLPLGITTTVSAGPHILGQPVTYSIEVCNPLPHALSNLQVQDLLNPSLLSFDAAASPNFTSSNSGGNVLLKTAYFSLPAAVGPLSPSCTTFTFVATPLVGARNCVATNGTPISNTASVQRRLSSCPTVPSNTVTIFPTTSVVIPASVSTLSQAISLGLLLPQNQSANIAQQVSIEGTLLMDLGNGSLQGYYFAPGSDITMYPGAEMIIPAEQRVTFVRTHVHGCSQMWRRILVERGGTIDVRENSLIEQGEYAIEMEDGGNYSLSKSTLRDNYVGLYAAPSGNPKVLSSLIQNMTFEGTGTANFLPPYTGQTTVPDTWPYAGIEFHDVIALNLTKYSGNAFQRLSTGILADQTNVTIRQGATFKNLKTVNSYGSQSNTGILMQSFSNPYQLLEDGFGGLATSPVTFEDCRYGIFMIGNIDFEITNNKMDLDITPNTDPAGVICFGAKARTGLIQHNYIESSQGGIFLYQNDDPNTNFEILDNEIILSEGGFFGGIGFYEGGVYYNPVVENNTINMYDARSGIFSLDQSGALIKENQINLFNDVIPSNLALGPIGYSNRTGIYTAGGVDQLFTCNVVQGAIGGNNTYFPAYDLSSLGYNNNNSNVFGIQAAQSTENTYECNQFDLIPNGIQVSGMPSVSYVKGNVFHQVGRGLWLTNASQISQQTHTGNRWTWSAIAPLVSLTPAQITSMGVAGAQNDAIAFASIIGSRFEFDAGANLDFEPFSIVAFNPGVWFSLQPSNGASFDCNNASICNTPLSLALANMNGGNLLALSNVEQEVVQNNLSPTLFPQTTLFETNKATYTKLKEEPLLAPTGSTAASFVQQQAQECEGAMYDVEVQYRDLNVLTQSLQSQVDQRQQQIEVGLTEIYRLDSLALVDTLHQDSLQAQAMLEQQSIESAVNQQAQLFDQQQQLKTQQADAIATQNTGVAVQYTAEENLQEVQEIYLTTIAKGIFSFNSDQIQSLDAIARECPLEGGLAVYKARSMVTFFTKVNYAALQACGVTEAIVPTESLTTDVDILSLLLPKEVKIYPNPANTYLMVEWDVNAREEGRLVIYNTLGQMVQQVALTTRSGQQEINLRKLSSGIYICKLFFDDQAVHEEKIIIQQP